MKRKIKFRIWNGREFLGLKQDRQYDYSVECPSFGEACAITRFLGEYDGDIEGAVIQQFTGLKDVQGREIYEGDILKTKGQLIGSFFRQGDEKLPAYPNNHIYTWLSQVIWDNGYASFLLDYINRPDYQGRGKFTEEMIGVAPWAEIVGNIFEHPKLLSQ